MRSSTVLVAGAIAVALGTPVLADDADKAAIRATYQDFVAAQNARDTDAIGAFFIDGPEFLWVSDGRSYWGRDAVLARMGSFQRAEVWEVTPDLQAARLVMLGEASAMFHLPLTLAIGQHGLPTELGFLVSILWVEEASGWRIASLLTTADKTPR
ncbi:MAG: nuclear transport factor 2 family protein [Paracoccaceae bacterium]